MEALTPVADVAASLPLPTSKCVDNTVMRVALNGSDVVLSRLRQIRIEP